MTPEEYSKNLKTILRHIKLVQDACLLLGDRLIENGEADFGRQLIANGFLHDNSKLHGIEWEHLVGFEKSDPILAKAIRHHVTTNPHHSEYWNGADNMPRIYVAEMCCDWYARSIEFGTDLREWIKNKAFDKYQIPPTGKLAKQIKDFIDLLLDEPFKQIKNKT